MKSSLNFIPILCVILMYAARIREMAKKRNLIKGEIKEGTTLQNFKLVGMFVVVASICEYSYMRPKFSVSWLLGGLALCLASFYIRSRAINALGAFWSLHVEIRSNHEFVTGGPFRFVRHPAYTSMVMEILAVGFFLQTPLSAAVGLLVFVPVLAKRVTIEERELIAKFGAKYINYMKHVPAFIPYKFRLLRAAE